MPELIAVLNPISKRLTDMITETVSVTLPPSLFCSNISGITTNRSRTIHEHCCRLVPAVDLHLTKKQKISSQALVTMNPTNRFNIREAVIEDGDNCKESCVSFPQFPVSCSPKARNKLGRTSLMRAVTSDCIDRVRKCLEQLQLQNLYAVDELGYCALMLAVERDNVEITKIIISEYCRNDYNYKQLRQRSRALLIATKRKNIKIVRLLIIAGINIDISGNNFATALHIAAEAGNLELVKLLVYHGADANRIDAHGKTALIKANANGKTNVVAYLLSLPISIDTVDCRGDTALSVSLTNNHIDCAITMIKHGANPYIGRGVTAADLITRNESVYRSLIRNFKWQRNRNFVLFLAENSCISRPSGYDDLTTSVTNNSVEKVDSNSVCYLHNCGEKKMSTPMDSVLSNIDLLRNICCY